MLTFTVALCMEYCYASMVHIHSTTNQSQAKGTYALDSIHHKAKQTSPKPTSEHLMLTSPSSHRASNM